MSIYQQAMLVSLTINKWNAKQHDKNITAEVELAHNTKGAGKFSKNLINPDAMASVTRAAGELRNYHYEKTLPWKDSGERLLPSKLYLEYTTETRRLKAQFETAVHDFLKEYPRYVKEAETLLGTMFDSCNYPNIGTMPSKFNISINITQIPNASDFRVEVAQEEVDKIKKDIIDQINIRQTEAVIDVYRRSKELVERVKTRLSAERPIIYDSLMQSVTDLADMIPAFNITNDLGLVQLETKLRSLVQATSTLKADPDIRASTAKAAAELLDQLNGNNTQCSVLTI